MTLKTLEWAFNLRLKPLQKLIVIMMTEMADQHGFCAVFPEKIADLTGIKLPRVIDNLQELEKLKVIKFEGRTAEEKLIFKLNTAYSGKVKK